MATPTPNTKKRRSEKPAGDAGEGSSTPFTGGRNLEVIDEENASTIWDDPLDTDREALDAVLIVIEKDGIRSFLDGEYEAMH